MMTKLEIASMQIILLGLELFLFWACTLLPIVMFVDKNKQSKYTNMEWLRNFIEIFLKDNYFAMNIIMSIFLIGINDFRAVLISTIFIGIFFTFQIEHDWSNYKSTRRAEERELRKTENAPVPNEHKCKIIKFPSRAV